MLGPNRWSTPERYMVRYHHGHLVWWWRGLISVLIVALALDFALTRAHLLSAIISDALWWYAVVVVSPLLTVLSFVVRPRLLNRIRPDWSLYRAVVQYRHAHVLAMLLCFTGGLLPCILAALNGSVGYPLLIAIIPLVAFVVHFPHGERFSHLVEHVVSQEHHGGDS